MYVGVCGGIRLPIVSSNPVVAIRLEFHITDYRSEMVGLGAETLGTETFLVSVLVSVPVRPKMSGLEKVLVS